MAAPAGNVVRKRPPPATLSRFWADGRAATAAAAQPAPANRTPRIPSKAAGGGAEGNLPEERKLLRSSPPGGRPLIAATISGWRRFVAIGELADGLCINLTP